MNYLPTCTSRLLVQHPCQVSFKSMQGCRRSWEDKLWRDGMTDKAKFNTKCPLAILWRGHKNCHLNVTCTEHKLDRGFISIFCYTDSLCSKSKWIDWARGKMRIPLKDIPLRPYSCHKTGHMKFSSHRGMRRGASSDVPLSEQKIRKFLYRACKM